MRGYNFHSTTDVIKAVFKNKTKTLHLKTKTKTETICDVYYWPTEIFFIFGRKWKCRRKWNSIYGRKRNENINGHSFSAEKRKRKSPDNIKCFCPFHTLSHQVSPTMRRQYLVQFRLFCRLTGFHFPHVQCIDIFVAFF